MHDTTADIKNFFTIKDKTIKPTLGIQPTRVVLESPYAGDIERNLSYARQCMKECLIRNEAPFASHLLYTQPGILNDNIPSDRRKGIEAGFCWLKFAELHVFYTDLGWSNGMRDALYYAVNHTKNNIEFRKLGRPLETAKINHEDKIGLVGNAAILFKLIEQ